MIVKKIGFDKVLPFTQRDINYQLNPQQIIEFYNFHPDYDGLVKAMEERKKFPINRVLLIKTIQSQYENLGLSDSQRDNLNKLTLEDTLTITTAHQPSIFGGPMYYVYKIISAINLAENLSKNTSSNIIPIFVNGSEDHDFEEVSSVNLFGKKLTWQSTQAGPIGRYKIDELPSLIEELKPILGESSNAKYLVDTIESSLQGANNYNTFVFNFVNKLFSHYGLIVINMDDKALKEAFIPIMKDEITNQSSEEIIKSTQSELSKLGYSNQAHAREINLFYLQDNSRERIIREGDKYNVNNSTLSFTKEEILNELETHPENFSPNVVMRPLYQETILPNIAYIGGGGEIAYWLERKKQFQHFNVFFPTLIRRDSVLIITKSQHNTLSKLGIEVDDLFLQEDRLIDKYLNATSTVDLNAAEEITLINKAFDSIKEKAIAIDKTLDGAIESERIKVIKQIEQLESRLKRSLKQKEETSVNQLKNLKQKLFPNNGLQERHDNFMQYYLSYGDDFFKILKDSLNPLDKDFVVLVEE